GRACAVLGLLAVPACAWVLSWPTWSDPPSPEALPQNGAAQKTPVFVFLFDDWSLVRSTRNGQWRPELRHLAALSREAVVCRQARSPSVDPLQSTLRIVCQTDRQLAIRAGGVGWAGDAAPLATAQAPNLLRAARERGYTTAVLGWGWPVRRTLGSLVDYWHAGQPHRAPDCPDERMAAAWLRNLRSCSDPISMHVGDPLRARQLGRRAVETQCLVAKARELIDTCPRNVLAVVHLPVPGWPFLWNADGAYRGPASEGPASAEGYRRSLRHQDRIVGQLVQHLKAAGKYDDALLVFTATRSWPRDPEPLHRQADGWMQHVPLLVKLPGQTTGHVVDGPVFTHRLAPLFHAVLEGERGEARLLDW
ncbi:sulfatase-like hydrolase/transferase, partial [bacterium]|nr:sulfatase-like hydrolase/transferase [bacterium]